jgi:HSP20 family protein
MATKVRTIRLRRLQGQLGDVAYELTKVHFSSFQTAETAWRPAVNAYRCERCVRICVDLAGVDRAEIDLRVEPGRLTLRGRRELPHFDKESTHPHLHAPALQVLAMEIDHGPFERQLALPADVVVEKITAVQRNGLLWISLPLRPHA